MAQFPYGQHCMTHNSGIYFPAFESLESGCNGSDQSRYFGVSDGRTSNPEDKAPGVGRGVFFFFLFRSVRGMA